MRIILPDRSSMVASAMKQQSSSKWTGVLVGSYSPAHVPSPHQGGRGGGGRRELGPVRSAAGGSGPPPSSSALLLGGSDPPP